jgi:hypothetical protein
VPDQLKTQHDEVKCQFIESSIEFNQLVRDKLQRRLTIIPKAAGRVTVPIEPPDAIRVADSCVVNASLEQEFEFFDEDDEGRADEEAPVRAVGGVQLF